jgi:hypothetical protein
MGLTTPAATTATRLVVTVVASNVMAWGRFRLRNSYCFLNRSTLLMSPKPKTKAWKLEDCQLSLFSGDSIRKSEQ